MAIARSSGSCIAPFRQTRAPSVGPAAFSAAVREARGERGECPAPADGWGFGPGRRGDLPRRSDPSHESDRIERWERRSALPSHRSYPLRRCLPGPTVGALEDLQNPLTEEPGNAGETQADPACGESLSFGAFERLPSKTARPRPQRAPALAASRAQVARVHAALEALGGFAVQSVALGGASNTGGTRNQAASR